MDMKTSIINKQFIFLIADKVMSKNSIRKYRYKIEVLFDYLLFN